MGKSLKEINALAIAKSGIPGDAATLNKSFKDLQSLLSQMNTLRTGAGVTCSGHTAVDTTKLNYGDMHTAANSLKACGCNARAVNTTNAAADVQCSCNGRTSCNCNSRIQCDCDWECGCHGRQWTCICMWENHTRIDYLTGPDVVCECNTRTGCSCNSVCNCNTVKEFS